LSRVGATPSGVSSSHSVVVQTRTGGGLVADPVRLRERQVRQLLHADRHRDVHVVGGLDVRRRRQPGRVRAPDDVRRHVGGQAGRAEEHLHDVRPRRDERLPHAVDIRLARDGVDRLAVAAGVRPVRGNEPHPGEVREQRARMAAGTGEALVRGGVADASGEAFARAGDAGQVADVEDARAQVLVDVRVEEAGLEPVGVRLAVRRHDVRAVEVDGVVAGTGRDVARNERRAVVPEPAAVRAQGTTDL
jgi:hypothetical protein